MEYNQLTLQERYYIEIELKNGTSQNQIAKALNRLQGTISKEFIIELLKPFSAFIKTITFDNGKEFAKLMRLLWSSQVWMLQF